MENLALHQQLAVFKPHRSRLTLHRSDRAFWVRISRFWCDWRNILHLAQPETDIRWHRQGFKYYWTWKCRNKGRPEIDKKLRQLVRDRDAIYGKTFSYQENVLNIREVVTAPQ